MHIPDRRCFHMEDHFSALALGIDTVRRAETLDALHYLQILAKDSTLPNVCKERARRIDGGTGRRVCIDEIARKPPRVKPLRTQAKIRRQYSQTVNARIAGTVGVQAER